MGKPALIGVIAVVLLHGAVSPGMAAEPSSHRTYPAKPIRLIVPFAPGGGADFVARLTGQKLSDSWGQPVVLDNRPGATGVIAAEAAAKAPPDGYTLYLGTIASLATHVSMYRKLPYDPVRDFAPVVLLSASPYLIAANLSLPVTSMQEVIALAKARPGYVKCGSPGTGGGVHLALELLKTMAKIDITHVPYRGSGPSLVALISGEVQLAASPTLSFVPQLKAGRIRGLAVTTAARAAALPEIPTLAEAGVPGYDASSWNGIVVPSRTPKAIIELLNREFARILALPDVAEKINNEGSKPGGGTPEEFGRHIKSEIAKWATIVKAIGAYAD